jgi:DNA-nicking Smr family endonuclease
MSRDRKKTPKSDRAGGSGSLWQQVAATVAPLKRKKDRVSESESAERAREAARAGRAAKTPLPKPAPKVSGPGPIQHPVPSRPAGPHPAVSARQAALGPTKPQPTDLQRTASRRLRSGRIEIEARLDLHGLRQHEAHAALRSFILRAQHRGQRWVLIITGKGGRTHQIDDDAYGYGRDRLEEPGVLRRNLPRWLAEPDLRPLVVGFETAAPRHGGEGAFYIHLRRRDRVDD